MFVILFLLLLSLRGVEAFLLLHGSLAPWGALIRRKKITIKTNRDKANK
jgi:hypothetical protein